MASLSSKIVILGLKLAGFKKIFSKNPIDYQKLRKSDVKKPPKKFYNNFDITINSVLQTTITEIAPKQKNRNKKLLFFIPGGAFISGPAKHHWDSIFTIVKQTTIDCWLIDYPKAPEVDILTISKNIEAAYIKAVEKYSSENIILMGDSVGGNLCISLIQKLIKQEQKTPQQLILITPVFDASMTNKEINVIDKTDPMLSKNGVLSAKKLCANGLDLKNELISPLYGNFNNFPKTTLFIGGRDIMYPDGKLAANKIKSHNVDVEVEVIDNKEMPHIWPLLPIMKESKHAINKIMKTIKLTSLLLVSSFLLCNCQPQIKKPKATPEPKIVEESKITPAYNPLKRKWMFVKLDTISRDTLIKYKAYIDLTQKNNLGIAKASCNSIGFTYNTNKNTIAFTDIISTEAYCKNIDHIERAIRKALHNCNKFKTEGHFLNLITKSNDTIKCVAEDWD